jgi:hypothetical protein
MEPAAHFTRDVADELPARAVPLFQYSQCLRTVCQRRGLCRSEGNLAFSHTLGVTLITIEFIEAKRHLISVVVLELAIQLGTQVNHGLENVHRGDRRVATIGDAHFLRSARNFLEAMNVIFRPQVQNLV